ncbi:MAG: hypothetical protein ACE5H2_09435, partial [Terriglobia bacterium]
ADRAGKDFGLFEQGQANLAVVVGGEHLAGRLLDLVPQGGLRREDVAGALDGLEARFGYGWASPAGRRAASRALGAM